MINPNITSTVIKRVYNAKDFLDFLLELEVSGEDLAKYKLVHEITEYSPDSSEDGEYTLEEDLTTVDIDLKNKIITCL
jgi:hypothetical protein